MVVGGVRIGTTERITSQSVGGGACGSRRLPASLSACVRQRLIGHKPLARPALTIPLPDDASRPPTKKSPSETRPATKGMRVFDTSGTTLATTGKRGSDSGIGDFSLGDAADDDPGDNQRDSEETHVNAHPAHGLEHSSDAQQRAVGVESACAFHGAQNRLIE